MQRDKCPACFGTDLCAELLGPKRVELKLFAAGWSPAFKGVTLAEWISPPNGTHVDIVLKCLAHVAEMKKFDVDLCESATGRRTCDVAETASKTGKNRGNFALWNAKANLTNFFACPSKRFGASVTRMYDANDDGDLSLAERRHLLTTLLINKEPIYLQVFPRNRGWPFPAYYGACGRAIAVEYAGKTLKEALGRPWDYRVWLSIEILDLAARMTERDGWAIYFGDYSPENFAVTSHGDVLCIDLEHLIVVDLRELETQGHLVAMDTDTGDPICDLNDPECATFSPQRMCRGYEREHNIVYACKNMLGFVGHKRLLDNPPNDVIASTIDRLLRACIYRSPGRRRRADSARELKTYLTTLLPPGGTNKNYYKSEFG